MKNSWESNRILNATIHRPEWGLHCCRWLTMGTAIMPQEPLSLSMEWRQKRDRFFLCAVPTLLITRLSGLNRFSPCIDRRKCPSLRHPSGSVIMERRYPADSISAGQFTNQQVKSMIAAYWGGVTLVYHCVGILITALIDAGKFDDTLFIFTTDHGDMLGNHGLFFKGPLMYDDLTRIPLIIRPPGGLQQTYTCARLISHADLTPTVIRWCGGEVPAGLEGKDAQSLFGGEKIPIRQGVAAEYHSGLWQDPIAPLRMWRTEEWK